MTPIANEILKTVTTYSQITGEILCVMTVKEGDLVHVADPFIYGKPEQQNSYVDNGVFVFFGEQQDAWHIFDYATKQWVDPRTLQDHKTAKWTELKQARSQAEYAGFTWDGSVFDSNAISQQRITGAVTLAQMDTEFSINWTLADNTVRQLNATQMKEVGAALGVHVATQFARAQDLRTQLDAAQTAEQVAAVNW
jgi:hypothetical protein